MEFNNNVNATFWRNLIDESSPMIDEAYRMASWYAGTSRMNDTEALNIVVYEDGKVNILCSKNSENRERQDIDKDYFENHKAYMVISRISKYSPYDNWIFNDYDGMREIIYNAIENENLWDELSKTIGDKNTIDELSDQQFIDAIKNLVPLAIFLICFLNWMQSGMMYLFAAIISSCIAELVEVYSANITISV